MEENPHNVDVFLGLGSNIEPLASLRAGMADLRVHFGRLECSTVYKSEAVGFDGPPFLNLAVKIRTVKSLPELQHELRQIEGKYGRSPTTSRFSSRRLDIDILLYGQLIGDFNGVTLPRPEILYSAHVLAPLSELYPSFYHPVAQVCLEELWEKSCNRSRVEKQDISSTWHSCCR